LYILFFPKLIAGPIVRYHDLADQITDRTANETIDNRLTGFYRFAIGLAKKVLIANQLGAQADIVFSTNLADVSTYTAWIGILAYTFQIYFDFSGYSDMAIGIAKMVGFKIPENFDNPYTSRSITEFWRRWHISLGNWMRNYLYIPLGGNKVDTKARLFFNLWIVFLLSGFWHGASWGFIIWGAYHGVFLILDRLFLSKVLTKVGGVISTLFTFLAVTIGWVFFREEKVGDAFHFIQRMFAFDSMPHLNVEIEFYLWFIIAILFLLIACFKFGISIQDKFYTSFYSNKKHLFIASLSLLLLGLSISSITSLGFNPFIYFRF
jgi:alginate O-acetyltransferase complex protein AlgI